MTNIIKWTLTGLSILLSFLGISYLYLFYTGLRHGTKIPDVLEFTKVFSMPPAWMFVVWVTICLFASLLFTKIILLWHSVRRPILEEEHKIKAIVKDVLTAARYKRQVNVLIQENLNLDAFAIGNNTIVLSKGLLSGFTESELRGIVAHELGHLYNRDGVALFSVLLTALFHFALGRSLKLIKALGKTLVFNMTLFFFAVVCMILFTQKGTLSSIWNLLVGLVAYYLMHYFLNYLRLWNSRQIEFDTDAYAQKIGFGASLRDALIKLSTQSNHAGNSFFYLKMTHPVIQERIRRLEVLEGMRQ